ncbi:hypothetical protein [Methanolobus sp.]|uniref:DUF7289 family protein n=1 Tax=Methanolobus sp. TaxID=1874737 RepID=UPI0025D2C699|nr:hypothetical protein [Methanolobus sp.]
MTQLDRNNSAVSETLGYIILFGIVTLSMGTIYAIGYPVLQSNIDANVFESAEQSFIVLQSSMKRVSFDQAPVKTLKMKLHGSEISVNDHSSNISISYDGTHLGTYPMGDIQFSKGKKSISYEMGSVIKKYSSTSMIMVSKPPVYTSTIDNKSVTTIGIVSINGNAWLSGRGITTVIMNHNSSRMEMPSGPTNVTVQIDSAHAPAWENYLEDAGFDISPGSTLDMVTATKNDTRLIVSRHIVDVKME